MACRSRERVARILAHQETDRVPFDATWSWDASVRAIIDGMDLDPDARECYLNGDFKYLRFDQTPDTEAFGPYLPGLPEEATISDWGVGKIPLKSVEGYYAGKKTFHPLARVDTVKELERYPFPDMAESRRHKHLNDEARTAKAQAYTVVGQMSQTILETAYQMRGMEQLLADLHERTHYVEVLFERIAEQRRFQAGTFATAGVDILRIGDDIATQHGLLVSPQMYRQWIRPHHAEIIAAARTINPDIHVLYHSDGQLTPLLPDLIDIGVTAINPVQPECMDPAEIKRDFGRHLTLWGCTSVQSVYAYGGREDVLSEIRTRMQTVAPGGGFVMQFTNEIRTPKFLGNLRTFFEVFYDLASY